MQLNSDLKAEKFRFSSSTCKWDNIQMLIFQVMEVVAKLGIKLRNDGDDDHASKR